MKNLIFYITLLLFSLTGNAQVYKFRAVEFVITEYQGKEVKPPIRQAVNNYPVTLNSDSGTFSIIGPKEQFFTVRNDPSGYKVTDSFVTIRFNAVDGEGVKCYVVVVIAKLESAKHDGFVIIAYPDKNYLYYVERDKAGDESGLSLKNQYNVDSFEVEIAYTNNKMIAYGIRKVAPKQWYVDDPEFDYKITECESLDMAIKHCLENRDLQVRDIKIRLLLPAKEPVPTAHPS